MADELSDPDETETTDAPIVRIPPRTTGVLPIPPALPAEPPSRVTPWVVAGSVLVVLAGVFANPRFRNSATSERRASTEKPVVSIPPETDAKLPDEQSVHSPDSPPDTSTETAVAIAPPDNSDLRIGPAKITPPKMENIPPQKSAPRSQSAIVVDTPQSKIPTPRRTLPPRPPAQPAPPESAQPVRPAQPTQPAANAAAKPPEAPPAVKRKVNDDGLGGRLETVQVWLPFGNLFVQAAPGHAEIATRNDGDSLRAGGLLCQRPFDLSESGICLQFYIDGLELSSEQDFEIFVLDDLAAIKDARMPAGCSSASFRRAGNKIEASAHKFRVECLVASSGISSARIDIRLDGRTVLTRNDERLRDVKRVFIGVRAIAQKNAAGGTVAIDNIAAAYRPRTVAWAPTVEDAQKSAQANAEPFGIFFCDPDTARLAGEGAKVIADFKRQTGNAPALTPFDTPMILGEFQSAGLRIFAKVASGNGSAELFKRYNAAPGTLVICAPDGSALASFGAEECKQTPLLKFLAKPFKDALKAWQTRADAAAKAAQAALPPRVDPAPAVPEKPAFPPAHAALHGAYKLGENKNLFAGLSAATDAEFAALRELGVHTILHVGGDAPNTELAAASKIRCVHIPLGFRAITPLQMQTLARALRDLPGPLYIESAEGVRAFAAAVIAQLTLGQIECAAGPATLNALGVPEAYSGLFAAVKSAVKADAATLNALHPEFLPRASVNPMVGAMVELDAIWKRIETSRGENWNAPVRPGPLDVKAAKDAGVERDASLLLERYLALSRIEGVADQPPAYRDILSEGVAGAASFTFSLGEWKKEQTPESQSAVSSTFKRSAQTCFNCHAQFRDRK